MAVPFLEHEILNMNCSFFLPPPILNFSSRFLFVELCMSARKQWLELHSEGWSNSGLREYHGKKRAS